MGVSAIEYLDRIGNACCEILGEQLIYCSTNRHNIQQYVTNVLKTVSMNYTGLGRM